jgi:hypothetical protein
MLLLPAFLEFPHSEPQEAHLMTTDSRQTLADHLYPMLTELFDQQPGLTTDDINSAVLTELSRSSLFVTAFPVLVEWAKETESDIWSMDMVEELRPNARRLVLTKTLKPIQDLLADDNISMGYYGDGEGFLGYLLGDNLTAEQHYILMTLFDERDEQTHAAADAVIGPKIKRFGDELGEAGRDDFLAQLRRAVDDDLIGPDAHDAEVNAALGVDPD